MLVQVKIIHKAITSDFSSLIGAFLLYPSQSELFILYILLCLFCCRRMTVFALLF